MRLQFFIARIFVGLAFGKLVWVLVAPKRVSRLNFQAGHQKLAEPDMASRIAIAIATALVGSIGVYLTTVEPESDPTVVSGTITAAAAKRAGAVVSLTHSDVGSANSVVRLPPTLPLNESVQVASFFVY
jgi:uncharacterized membrane protein (DUF441 family)